MAKLKLADHLDAAGNIVMPDNIGRGYWGRERETELAFQNKLQSGLPSGGHSAGAPADALWFRTGDLASTSTVSSTSPAGSRT